MTCKYQACEIQDDLFLFRFVLFSSFSFALFLPVGTLEGMDVVIITMDIMYIRVLSEIGFNNALLA